MRKRWIPSLLISILISTGALWACQRYLGPGKEIQVYEVWAMDQSDTNPSGGGLLYIWEGASLAKGAGTARPQVIDLAQAARAAGYPVAKRPHMVLTNHSSPASHAIISNVGSGDLFFVDISTRRIVGHVSVVGAGGLGSVQAHAAAATPDNRMVIVADMAGNALHKIQTDYRTNRYTLVETLDLKGFAGDLDSKEAKPICHEFTADSQFAYVTMAEGGVVVVRVGSDSGSARMSVVKVYPRDTVPGIGCGAFRLPEGHMVTNGESGAGGGDDFLFLFDTSGAASGRFPDPERIELPGEDTHGVGLCTDESGNRFAVAAMRVSNEINFVDLQTFEVVRTESLARSFSPDPKPDVAEVVGDKMFVALRGPKPLTAIGGLQDARRTPGVAVFTLARDCTSLVWDQGDLAPMSDPLRTTTLEDGARVTASDPHGLKVILR